jgi:hypothetical protein
MPPIPGRFPDVGEASAKSCQNAGSGRVYDPRVSTTSSATDGQGSARELVTVVLVEAVGSSVTPFVPLPFVDDFIFGRLLRRIARKVIARRTTAPSDALVKALVEGYTRAGEAPLGEKAAVAAARFIIRKVAVVLDVKKSHDVFGEAIAFALALDVAVERGALREETADRIGGVVFRAVRGVGGGAIEVLAQSVKSSFTASATDAEASRFARISQAVGQRVDETRSLLERAMHYELGGI